MSTGNLVVIAAPSGTGKTTICKKLLKNNSEWKFSVSATTRNLRNGEVDGKDYLCMSNEKFEHAVKFGDFFEWDSWLKLGKIIKIDSKQIYVKPLKGPASRGAVASVQFDIKKLKFRTSKDKPVWAPK